MITVIGRMVREKHLLRFYLLKNELFFTVENLTKTGWNQLGKMVTHIFYFPVTPKNSNSGAQIFDFSSDLVY